MEILCFVANIKCNGFPPGATERAKVVDTIAVIANVVFHLTAGSNYCLIKCVCIFPTICDSLLGYDIIGFFNWPLPVSLKAEFSAESAAGS